MERCAASRQAWGRACGTLPLKARKDGRKSQGWCTGQVGWPVSYKQSITMCMWDTQWLSFSSGMLKKWSMHNTVVELGLLDVPSSLTQESWVITVQRLEGSSWKCPSGCLGTDQLVLCDSAPETTVAACRIQPNYYFCTVKLLLAPEMPYILDKNIITTNCDGDCVVVVVVRTVNFITSKLQPDLVFWHPCVLHKMLATASAEEGSRSWVNI